jgi:hypothetical protein
MEPEIKPVENLDDFSTAKYRDLVKSEPKQVVVAETEDDEREDFEQARSNIKEIIDKGQNVLDDMIALAKASDHPRSYEVAATLIKTLVDTNKDLLDLHKKRKELQGKQESNQNVGTQNVQNNTVFVGSGIELLEMLKGNK